METKEIIKALDVAMLTDSNTLNYYKRLVSNCSKEEADRLIEYKKSLGPLEIYQDTEYSTEWLYLEQDGKLYIAFRATDSVLDWVQNFLFFKKVTPFKREGKADKLHNGFLSKYERIREEILAKVKGSTYLEVVVTGISQAAGIAVICALDIQYNNPDKNITCVAFGTPRVGNADYSIGFNKYIKNAAIVKQGNDIVTHVPPKLFGFYDISTLLRIGPKKFFYSILDHYPSRYYKALRDL